MRVERGGRVGLVAALLCLGPSLALAQDEVTSTSRRAAELEADGQKADAEALLESLTRVHADDPRAWSALAELRVRLRAPRGATYAFHRAAGMASEATRRSLAARLEALKLPPFPKRVAIASRAEFLARARVDACRAGWEPGAGEDPLPCGQGLGDEPGADYRIPAPMAHRYTRDPRSWVRAAALEHAPLDAFWRPFTRRLWRERDPRVRLALLRRLVARRGEVPLDRRTLQTVRAYLAGADPQVLALATSLLHESGEALRLAPEAFLGLVRQADDGRASKAMVRAVYTRQRAALTPALLGLLAEPRRDEGKAAAIYLLALDGERSGQLRLAEAFAAPGAGLGRHLVQAHRALRMATAGQGVTLGRDPKGWVEALRR